MSATLGLEEIGEFERQRHHTGRIIDDNDSGRPKPGAGLFQRIEIHRKVELIGGDRVRWLKLVPATAAMAAVIFGFVEGPTLWADFQVKQAQKAVATAFVERRTTLSRLPSVGYAPYNPFPIVLGAEDGRGVDEVRATEAKDSGTRRERVRAVGKQPLPRREPLLIRDPQPDDVDAVNSVQTTKAEMRARVVARQVAVPGIDDAHRAPPA